VSDATGTSQKDGRELNTRFIPPSSLRGIEPSVVWGLSPTQISATGNFPTFRPNDSRVKRGRKQENSNHATRFSHRESDPVRGPEWPRPRGVSREQASGSHHRIRSDPRHEDRTSVRCRSIPVLGSRIPGRGSLLREAAALRSFVSKSFFPSLAFHVFSRIEGDYPRRSRYVSPGVLQSCSLVDSPDPRSLKSPIPQRGWVLIFIDDSVRGITSSITEFQQHLPLLRLPTDSGRRGKPFRYRFLLLRSSSLLSKDRIRLTREEVMGYAGRITCWMVR